MYHASNACVPACCCACVCVCGVVPGCTIEAHAARKSERTRTHDFTGFTRGVVVRGARR